MKLRRRKLLQISGLGGLLALSGCVKALRRVLVAGRIIDKSEPRTNDNEGTNVDREDRSIGPGEGQLRCTSVQVHNFEWDEPVLEGSEHTFSADIVNQADYAGTVEISLEFYKEETQRERQGIVRRSFAIGSQERRKISISAQPPTKESNYAVMKVSDQDCTIE